MKLWSLDARSRRRKPQVLCVEGEENSRIPYTGETVDKSSTHRENLASSGWINGEKYIGQTTQ